MDLPFNTLVSKGLRGDGGSRDPRRVFLPTCLMPASADVPRLLVCSFTVTAVEVLREAEEEEERDGSWPSSPLVPAVLTCLSAGVAGPGEPAAAWADWESNTKLEWIIPNRRATRPGFNPPSFETAGIYSSDPSNGVQYGCHIEIENNRKQMDGIERWVRHLCGQPLMTILLSWSPTSHWNDVWNDAFNATVKTSSLGQCLLLQRPRSTMAGLGMVAGIETLSGVWHGMKSNLPFWSLTLKTHNNGRHY